MFAVPLGLIGVLAMLFVTRTVSNSILLVEFANRLRSERGMSVRQAAKDSAASTQFGAISWRAVRRCRSGADLAGRQWAWPHRLRLAERTHGATGAL
jgi:hypothetical protein